MKRHIAPILIALSFLVVAYALGGSGSATRTVTSATLTINVGPAHFMEIYNFTQVGGSGQRGTVVVGVFPTPTPTPAPTPTPVPTPTPIFSTIAGGSVVIGSGDNLTDEAILFGDNSPTGTITFTLQDPSSAPVYTDVVTVTGNGTYTTDEGSNHGGFPPIVAGTYVWSATYSGDSNNPMTTDNGQNETETVFAPTPTPTPIVGTVLTATLLDPGSTHEPIKPIIIQGTAIVTINPVPGATLSLTYRKFAEPTPSPTATVTTFTFTPTPTPIIATEGVSSGGATIMETTTLDEDTDLSTPTPTPTSSDGPVLVATVTPTPTPQETPSATPTPTPTPTP